jgi:GDP/UDP-N,N'-diacetylbacillosamine 2-epimerase (hydrolysing)
LHGGELTEGAYDDALRHSITKMSHLHFVAAEPYRQRVMQLGESPHTVFMVGGLGVDRILHEPILERAALETALGFQLGKKNLLVTLHPETLGVESSATAITQLLDALSKLKDTHLIFTLPNADNGGQIISTHIHAFVAKHRNAIAYEALGQSRYLSCLAHCDAVVGNSSSGIMEAPSFQKPTVNMGQRQRGRLRAPSVIDCEVHSDAILAAIDKALSPEFARQLSETVNPYGAGGASEKIVNVIETYPLQALIPKTFFDWKSL